MTLVEFEGKAPRVDPSAFVAAGAVLIGDVIVEPGASVWYNVVLRADYGRIVVGAGANVQDGSVIHCTGENDTVLAPNATIAHNCTIHGASVGAGSVIANGSVVLDGAVIGAGSIVAAGSVVAAGASIGDGVLAVGAPAQVKRSIDGTPAAYWVEATAPAYAELAARHRAGTRVVEAHGQPTAPASS